MTRPRLENALLLRARLVDRHGALLRPGDVRSIYLAIVGPAQAEVGKTPIAIAALTPAAVVLDGLHIDDDWSVDACGYNFCHGIEAEQFDIASLPARCEFRYIIEDTSGRISVVRFEIKGDRS